MSILPYIGYSWYEMYLIFCFWSIIGWFIEVIDMTIETGKFQNRGFLHIPFCPIYGFGMLLINILLKDVKDTFFPLFFASMSICTIFEYFVGWGLEKLFHARWWDYSHMRFNYKGRICLRNALLFGFGCVFIMRIIEPFVERKIDSIPVYIGKPFLVLISLIIAADTAVSLVKAYKLKIQRRDYTESALSNESDAEIITDPVIMFSSHK